jgi:hypothetical protein
MVDAPETVFPARAFDIKALKIAAQSMPRCSKKRLSSRDIRTSLVHRPVLSKETGTHHSSSPDNETSRKPPSLSSIVREQAYRFTSREETAEGISMKTKKRKHAAS